MPESPAGPSGHVYLVSAARTPIGKFGGPLAAVPATTLGGVTIRAAVERSGLPADTPIDEVLMGQVLQAGAGQAPARQAALAAGLADTTSATTINRVCGSGLKAIMLAAAEIRAGDAEVAVAGGMESMNGAPYLLPGARFGYRLGSTVPNSLTFPTSFRARSTSIKCSAFSFSSARRSLLSFLSSDIVFPLFLVPAIGNVSIFPFSTLTSISGLDPIISRSPSFR